MCTLSSAATKSKGAAHVQEIIDELDLVVHRECAFGKVAQEPEDCQQCVAYGGTCHSRSEVLGHRLRPFHLHLVQELLEVERGRFLVLRLP